MDFGQSVGRPSEVKTGDRVNQLKVIRERESGEKAKKGEHNEKRTKIGE